MRPARSPVPALALALLAGSAVGAAAQDAHRIWGRVHTTEGAVHEGFIRWDRNEGSWVDILDGSKGIPDVNYLVWLAATGEEPAVRAIEVAGYRVTWDEEDPDFPDTRQSGIRFGHLASLTVLGRDRVEARLRSGELVELSGGSSDIGTSIREILVDVPGSEEVELRWRELERIDFAPPPLAARARSARLYGSVEDVRGDRYEGYVSWDLDEILATDILDGEEIESGRDRRIEFGDIVEIVRIRRGSRVTLRDGAVLELTGSNDVERGHRGVQISDPALGMVEVEWPDFHAIRFQEPSVVVAYDDFPDEHALRGTVTTRSGEEMTGVIRWDADEAWSWELLTGSVEDVGFAIELAFVDRIVRGEAFGASVTLTDGRSFELEGSEDLDWDNKGVMVGVAGGDADDPASWRLVPWEEFGEVRFHHAPPVEGQEPGSRGERIPGAPGDAP
jgi:hypothetical protein